MDDVSFGAMARALAGGFSRRRVLGGGIAAAIFAVTRIRRAGAQEVVTLLGGVCTVSSQCAPQFFDGLVSGQPICGDNGYTSDGPLNCCLPEGEGCCFSDGECCGSLRCRASGDGPCSGDCTSQKFGELSPGDQCTTSDECRQGYGGPTFCADNGIATDGELNCCRYEGRPCFDGTGCCGDLLCINGSCQY